MIDTLQGMAAAALLLTFIVITSRQDRRIRYLQSLAGKRDYWDTRCHHCRRRMRDADSIADTRPGPVPGSTTRTVWHMNRPACAEAARLAARPAV